MFKRVSPIKLNITPTAVWTTVSQAEPSIPLSSLLPPDTAALFLHVVASGGNEYLGLRKPGSSDNRTNMMPGNSHQWTVVGVDAGITFQAFLSNNLSQSVYLVGYMTAESGVILNNGVSQTGTNWAWVEKDCQHLSWRYRFIFEMLADVVFVSGTRQQQDSISWLLPFLGVIGCDINLAIDYTRAMQPNISIYRYIIRTLYSH
jgi:hypothetical protein